MTTVTIPKKITKGAELVVLSRKEYEQLLTSRLVPEFHPSAAEKKDLARARKNRLRGNFLTIYELKRKLGFTN